MATNLMQSKPRFEILDGLRGVAALIVVAFHLFETYSPGPCGQILNHGYLAVDFFFILSGFVIGYAYDDRWPRMTQWNFYLRRLIRLQPMLIMGVFIGAVWFYFGDAPLFDKVMSTPWWMVLGIMLLSFIMFPVPPSLDIRGWAENSPLNGPQWSLMWEYLANILYASVVRRFSKAALSVFVILSGVLTVFLCCNIDAFGLLEARSWAAYTPIGGWAVTADQLYVGISRLLYPFFGGLLLYRLGKRIVVPRYGFFCCSLALAVLLVFPHVGGDTPNIWNGVYCSVAILLFFPMIVAAGAGSPLKGEKEIRICKFLGEISYPLYITHYPLIYMQMGWAARHADAPLSTHIFVSVATFIVSVGVAYALLKLYDLPVRKWLTDKFLYRTPATQRK